MKKRYPKIDLNQTGQNIRRIMRLNGLTVRDIQKHLELAAPQSIYHWFDGKCLPTVDNLYALSELFHVPMDALICGNRKNVPEFYNCFQHKWLIVYYEKGLKLWVEQKMER